MPLLGQLALNAYFLEKSFEFGFHVEKYDNGSCL
jgi:hypothetical protein